MLHVGDYLLGPVIGRGGAGVVHDATHRPTGARAAVKLLHSLAGDEAQHAIADEVRAVARLDHRHIVAVYDHGVLTAADGPAQAWIAMERATAALDRRPPPTTWTELRGLLVAILGALGHAHARGVIHRDVKPGNVLIGADGTPRLSDFGIARALDRDDPDSPTWHAGTPQYAAPEQLARAWRRQGPPTDLYAVGCLAWELSAGGAVFPGLVGTELSRAVAFVIPGAYTPVLEVPDALEAWIRRLLEKDPRARPATAALALAALPAAADRGVARAGVALVSAPTAVPSATFQLDSVPTLPTAAAPEGSPGDLPRPSLLAVPDDWRAVEPPARVRPIPVGPSLFGWRDPPPVGRDAERDRLWSALRASTAQRRVVILEGPAGVGKSRLARWLVEAVAELGVATPWRATHGATPGAQDGLVGMLLRGWRAGGLDRARLTRHLAHVHGRPDPDLLDLLVGDTPLPRDDRHRAVTRALGEAPSVIWLDDLQWGADTIQWATGWLDGAEGAPGLVVATVRSDEAVPRELAALRDHPATETVTIGHLGAEGQARLVDALVNLAPDLVRRVVDRTDGHPLFAVELLGDWIRRGALVPSALGYIRPADAPALEIPDGIRALWQGRVSRLGLSPGQRAALEAVAALGRSAPAGEWRAVGLDADAEATLVASGLARPTPDGMELAHGLLRDSLEQEAARAGRWLAAQSQAADALVGLDAAPARIGRHLFRAERWNDAVEPLRRGAELARLGMELDIADALLVDADHAARLAGGDADPRLPAVWMLTAWVQQLRGEPGSSAVIAERGWVLADRLGLARDAGDAAWMRAEAARAAGDAPVVAWWLARAERAYTDAGHLEGLSDVVRVQAAVLGMQGDPVRARIEIARALTLAEASGAPAARPNTLLLWASIEGRAGDLERSRTLALEAQAGFAAIGSRVRETHARIALAELARRAGHWEEAELRLRELETTLGPGASAADSVAVGLALLLLDRGQYSEAARRLAAIVARTRAPGRYAVIALAWLGLAELGARSGDWEAVAVQVEEWAARTSPSGMHADPDAQARLARLEVSAREDGQAALAARIRALSARSVAVGG